MNRRSLLGSIAALVAWPFSRKTSLEVCSYEDIPEKGDWHLSKKIADPHWVIYYPPTSTQTMHTESFSRVVMDHLTVRGCHPLEVVALFVKMNRKEEGDFASPPWKLSDLSKPTHRIDWTEDFGSPPMSRVHTENLKYFSQHIEEHMQYFNSIVDRQIRKVISAPHNGVTQ